MSVFQADPRAAVQRQTWTKTTVKCKSRTVYIYSESQCTHCVLKEGSKYYALLQTITGVTFNELEGHK